MLSIFISVLSVCCCSVVWWLLSFVVLVMCSVGLKCVIVVFSDLFISVVYGVFLLLMIVSVVE